MQIHNAPDGYLNQLVYLYRQQNKGSTKIGFTFDSDTFEIALEVAGVYTVILITKAQYMYIKCMADIVTLNHFLQLVISTCNVKKFAQ